MAEQNEGKSGLGHLLQGVQHIGVTVENMAKSMEFYIDVLGGKEVVEEPGLIGDTMQNTLFQKEELDAISQGVDPKALGIPNLRDGVEALDVRFISFGNTVIELIHFRDATLDPLTAPSSVPTIPSHAAHVNSMHLSFHVKDDMDLNLFAKMLEDECQKRGLTNVVFNRIVRVKSEAERKAIALKYNSCKFWNEPEDLAAGKPEQHFGVFEGWSLFYCKGPSGEQIEFNQVTRNVKKLFAQARTEYNEANGTNFST